MNSINKLKLLSYTVSIITSVIITYFACSSDEEDDDMYYYSLNINDIIPRTRSTVGDAFISNDIPTRDYCAIWCIWQLCGGSDYYQGKVEAKAGELLGWTREKHRPLTQPEISILAAAFNKPSNWYPNTEVTNNNDTIPNGNAIKAVYDLINNNNIKADKDSTYVLPYEILVVSNFNHCQIGKKINFFTGTIYIFSNEHKNGKSKYDIPLSTVTDVYL
ncbi:MAG: hypothetical protein IJ139_04805 [Bacteroidaceae bacterium]|nr:hypothetical protein [Bacteroidaceae bacterium]MBQ9176169.1 hypothetical protein [Bacteroidaceae bacterium]MBR1379302.1 hypothetical protein [Bacteroidaceae bacterium]